jgi:hypothetical protein
MRHPDERHIALYAGGDAGWVERVSIGWHVARCGSCARLVEAYRRDRQALRQEMAELPADLDWNRLAAEMTANIRVGLEAGECVSERTSRAIRLFWRPAFAGAGLALVLLGAWYLNFPAQDRQTLGRGIARLWSAPPATAVDAGVSLEATRAGIQVSENGSAMTVMNPGTQPPVVVVSTRGSLRARYVDDDTGQVTITNVYAQ